MLKRYNEGMTLIEIVIVIAIIATLASVAIPTLITSLDVQDNKTTKESMEALKTAMLNYYRDVGKLPRLDADQKEWSSTEWGVDDFKDLDALLYNPFDPDSTDIKEYINHLNWNGPYILSSFKSDDYKYDAWGREYLFDPDYGKPQYMLGSSIGNMGYGTSSEHGGAEYLSSNAALLVSQGKIKGYGRKKNESGENYQGWYGILNSEKIKLLTPPEMNPSSEDDYIAMMIDPRAARALGTRGSLDDEKIDNTKQKLETIKEAIISFVADLGVVIPYNQTGAIDLRVPIAMDSEYFSQFPNPLLMLAYPFFGDSSGSYSGGKVKDRLPPYLPGNCYSFDDTQQGRYAQMGWKGPYFQTQGKEIDNGSIPEFDITFEDFIDDWGNPLQVPFAGDNLWLDYGAVYDPNFGNVSQGDPNYDSMYDKYSGLLISGGPNGVLNSAYETITYLDPSASNPNSGVYPGIRTNDDIWVYINKNEIMANFAASGAISRALDSGDNVQVNTGLNIDFQFPGNPGFGSIKYTVKSIALIYADQSQAYNFKVRTFPNINYPLDSVNEDRINKGFTKEDFQRGDSMSTDQVFVPVGKVHIYALIEANNPTKTGRPHFPQGCEPSTSDNPEWSLSHLSRWGKYLELNTKDSNVQASYGVFYAPLDIDNGSGSFTVSIPVSVATVQSPI